ncbi:MAG TPA: peptidoglycan DD-metalloendopeptidase family protein [Bacillota bacterium]
MLGAGALVVVAAVALLAWAHASPTADSTETPVIYQVVVDGRTIAHVGDPSDLEFAVAALEEKQTLASGVPMQVVSRVEARPVQVAAARRPRLSAGAALEYELSRVVRLQAQAVAVVVDGQPVVALRTEAEARAAVEQVLAQYRQQVESGEYGSPGGTRLEESVNVQSVEIVENIRFEKVSADDAELKDVDQAVAILMRGTDKVVAHTVQSGESLWTIAHANGMSVEDLEQANPQVDDPKRLQPGDQLNLIVPDPFVSLRSVEIRSYQRPIAFRTVYENDPELYPWEEYVKEPGQQGRRAVVERVERLNGEITAVETVSDEILSEPTVQVVVRGSKEVAELGSGVFRWPLDIPGQLTTRFGWSRWRGRNHNGIDIAAPRGTQVYAVDDGYVSHAGWKNGLGQTVIVNHGGGRETVYAHLSTISVSVGAQVNKSTVLGGVGNTGYSFGNHLHFEVHVNGSPVDPLGYFK